jgi:hypothetical protein
MSISDLMSYFGKYSVVNSFRESSLNTLDAIIIGLDSMFEI